MAQRPVVVIDDVQPHLEELRKKIEELRDDDFSYNDLAERGFQEAESSKRQLLDYITGLLELIDQNRSTANSAIVEEGFQFIRDTIKRLGEQSRAVRTTVEHGVTRNEFQSERESHIAKINKFNRACQEELHPLELELKVDSLRKKLEQLSLQDASDAAKRAIEVTTAAEKALQHLQGQIMRTAVRESEGTFGSLQSNHARKETLWFRSFVIAGIITVAAIIGVTCCVDTPTDAAALTFSIWRRLLVVSVPLVFLKISLSKYNIERNLRIIYDHRQTVLKQYSAFESAIGDDADAKNAFRLEIAKYIFSDPQTGYLGKAATSELNFHPIFNMTDKMVK